MRDFLRDKGTIIRRVIIVLLVCLIVYEAYNIYIEEHERSLAVSEYDSIEEAAVSGDTGHDTPDGNGWDGERSGNVVSADGAGSVQVGGYPDLTVDYDLLKKQNSDYIGWLYWKFDDAGDRNDFEISYPVVLEQARDEYLHKTFKGQVNSAGCIFMDLDSIPSFDGYSDFLFGHNMRNGTMFGSMDNIYRSADKEAISRTPQYVYVYTKDAILQYVVFEYELTNSGNEAVYRIISDEDDYDTYVKRLKKLGNYKCPVDIDFEKRPELLNLSTCSGSSGTNRRLVVHCVKVGNI